MANTIKFALGVIFWLCLLPVRADVEPRVVDIPTRPGVKQRLLVLAPPSPKAAVILFAGGHGGLQIAADGSFGWGKGNFLMRSRQLFVDQGLLTVVIDAPSDRQSPPFLAGFRQGAEHAVIAWVRQHSGLPVWLVGTSRGTQSIAAVATRLSRADGPDGLVVTATILTDPKAPPVTAMTLERLSIPVLVAHHELPGRSLRGDGVSRLQRHRARGGRADRRLDAGSLIQDCIFGWFFRLTVALPGLADPGQLLRRFIFRAACSPSVPCGIVT